MNGRIIGAGLLAGLVLNIGEAILHGVLIAEPAAAAMQALGRDIAGTTLGLSLLVGITFAQGVVGMALYAALRERSRASAVWIGLALWLLSGAYSATYFYAGFPGLIPDDVLWWPVVWELVQYPAAMLAGAAVYKER